jgi:hypothetical protein
MARTASNEVAEKSDAQKAFERMLERMELAAKSEDEDFGNPMLTGIVGILEAETEEEMWDADDLAQIGGRNLRDVEQRIIGYDVRFSTNPNVQSVFKDSQGRGMYLLVRSIRYDTGAEFIWNTSAPLLVGKILWLADRDMLPADVVIRGTHLGGDQWVLKLKKMPERVQATEPPF